MTIDLSDNSPRASYVVAAGVTRSSFSVSFEFFDNEDLNAYVDGVLKTLTTDYTVSGGDGSTGTLTMSVTGASGGSTVVITRAIDLERTTDFPSSGPFNIASLNTELDRFVAIAADLKDQADRALQLTDYDAAVSLALPDIDTRKGKTLAFNEVTGAVESGPSVSDVQTVSNTAADIATLADIEDGTVATHAIQTVAGIASDVSTVSSISASVTTVATNIADVSDVADNMVEVLLADTNAATATTKAAEASASATAAAASETAAGLSETATAADAVATAADRVQTGLDVIATAADLVATNADVVTTNTNAAATAQDAAATAADVITTNQNVIDTAAATNADAIATAADRVATNQDAIATAADVVLTHADAASTAANLAGTAQDVTDATSAKDAAEAAQVAAESARDTTYGLTGTYPDIASGLAATTDTEFFTIVGTGLNYIELYLNDGGTAVFKKSLYGGAKIDEMEETQAIGTLTQAAAIAVIQSAVIPAVAFQ